MKSSITTTSRAGVSGLRLPLVIRTTKTRSPASNPTPRNERLPRFVGPARTFRLKSSRPATSKYSIFVLSSSLTPVKTEPNPPTAAPVCLPGTKKTVSRMLLSRAAKRRSGLKVLKILGKSGWRLPKRTGVLVGLTLSALTWKPDPGVKNRAPRGELALKKFAGRLLGAEKASGTPSQLISRRPLGNEPGTLGLRAPRKARKASTEASISAGVAPDASNTTGAAIVDVGDNSTNAASATTTDLIMEFSLSMTSTFDGCAGFEEMVLTIVRIAPLGRRHGRGHRRRESRQDPGALAVGEAGSQHAVVDLACHREPVVAGGGEEEPRVVVEPVAGAVHVPLDGRDDAVPVLIDPRDLLCVGVVDSLRQRSQPRLERRHALEHVEVDLGRQAARE